MPLYLFDKHFASKAPQLAADYKVLNPAQDSLPGHACCSKAFLLLVCTLFAVSCALDCHACKQTPSLLVCSSLGICMQLIGHLYAAKFLLKHMPHVTLTSLLSVHCLLASYACDCSCYRRRCPSISMKTCCRCWVRQGGLTLDGSSWDPPAQAPLFTRTPMQHLHGMLLSQAPRSGSCTPQVPFHLVRQPSSSIFLIPSDSSIGNFLPVVLFLSLSSHMQLSSPQSFPFYP